MSIIDDRTHRLLLGAIPNRRLISRSIALFLPSTLILYFALHSGRLPDADYWYIIKDILPNNDLSPAFSSWFVRSNEHLIVIPRLLYAINIQLTNGNNVGLALIPWIAALVQVALLYSLLPPSIRASPKFDVTMLLLISLFIFTPRASRNWFMGMSGAAWITANLFVVAAVVLFWFYHQTKKDYYYLSSIGAALCGYLTYSTSLAIWPALCFGAFLLRMSKKHLLGYCISTMAIYFLHLNALYSMSYSTQSTQGHLLARLANYLAVFIGGLFVAHSDKVANVQLFGLIGLAISALLFIFIIKLRHQQKLSEICVPWFMLQLYAIGNGLMAGISRSHLGISQGLSSRYESLPTFFWLATCVLTVFLFWHSATLKRIIWLPVTITLGLICQMHLTSYPDIRLFLQRAERKPLAEVSIYTGAYDISLLKEVVTLWPQDLIGIIEQLKKQGHIPFSEPLADCVKMNKQLEVNDIDTQGTLPAAMRGNVDNVTVITPQAVKVTGWTDKSLQPLTCVALLNQDNVVRGLGIAITNRPAPAAATIQKNEQRTEWEGYALLQGGDSTIRAFVSNKQYPQQWVLVGNSLPIQQ